MQAGKALLLPVVCHNHLPRKQVLRKQAVDLGLPEAAHMRLEAHHIHFQCRKKVLAMGLSLVLVGSECCLQGVSGFGEGLIDLSRHQES